MGKNSVRNSQYGPRTGLVRGMNTRPLNCGSSGSPATLISTLLLQTHARQIYSLALGGRMERNNVMLWRASRVFVPWISAVHSKSSYPVHCLCRVWTTSFTTKKSTVLGILNLLLQDKRTSTLMNLLVLILTQRTNFVFYRKVSLIHLHEFVCKWKATNVPLSLKDVRAKIFYSIDFF